MPGFLPKCWVNKTWFVAPTSVEVAYRQCPYRVSSGEIRILRVIHASRDVLTSGIWFGMSLSIGAAIRDRVSTSTARVVGDTVVADGAALSTLFSADDSWRAACSPFRRGALKGDATSCLGSGCTSRTNGRGPAAP